MKRSLFFFFSFLSKIQSELLGFDGSKKKRHLRDDAVPSFFSYAPPQKKFRQTSIGRANRRSQQEVGCKMMQLTTVLSYQPVNIINTVHSAFHRRS